MLVQPWAPVDALRGLTRSEKKNAPEALYTAGNRALIRQNPRIAIVGSRKPSSEGEEQAFALARWIAEHDGIVVSGLAEGVDAAAHNGALAAANGGTIAVLGTPLHEYYPRKNRELQDRLMREQLVVSQFGEHSVGPKGFVMRNRTMALISHATVIIEAGEKSGTKHQGWEALRLHRMLYLPKKLVDSAYPWPQEMIQYGAEVYDSLEHLQELLGFDYALAEPLESEPAG